MNLQLQNKNFLICGASSGFGNAIATTLLNEGANVFLVARREELLKEMAANHPGKVEYIAADLKEKQTITRILELIKGVKLTGAVINGGGPKALSALETNIEDWDEAYQLIMRWKIELSLKLIPLLEKADRSRLLFIESHSIKQPIPNLVMSNAYRAAIAGFAKSLATDVAKKDITVNILAPGSHETPAIERVIIKNSETTGKTYEQVKAQMEATIPVGRMGKGEEIASLAAWILSPHASFITGQVITHDGGKTAGLFG